MTLRSRLADQAAIFEVHDNGVGLSEEDKQRVFEMFYRVKKDREMAQGTGLGLPLAKHIVEDVHGGRLSWRANWAQGAHLAWCCRLPRRWHVTCELRAEPQEKESREPYRNHQLQ